MHQVESTPPMATGKTRQKTVYTIKKSIYKEDIRSFESEVLNLEFNTLTEAKTSIKNLNKEAKKQQQDSEYIAHYSLITNLKAYD
ncbi:MAG: hypothetical protein ACRCXZ_06905 [Patescibacteria group bacterium]